MRRTTLGVLICAALFSACSKDATEEDCRDDWRCVEIPEKGSGTFISKNPSDPCPCE